MERLINEKQQLICLINSYIGLVRASIEVLKQNSNRENTGTIRGQNGIIRYEYHGNGCLVKYDDLTINFDFDLDNITRKHMVFDISFLTQYWEERKQLYPALTPILIHELLEHLLSDKLIIITGFIPRYELTVYPLPNTPSCSAPSER